MALCKLLSTLLIHCTWLTRQLPLMFTPIIQNAIGRLWCIVPRTICFTIMLHAADPRDKAVADCYTAYVVSEIEVLNIRIRVFFTDCAARTHTLKLEQNMILKVQLAQCICIDDVHRAPPSVLKHLLLRFPQPRCTGACKYFLSVFLNDPGQDANRLCISWDNMCSRADKGVNNKVQ